MAFDQTTVSEAESALDDLEQAISFARAALIQEDSSEVISIAGQLVDLAGAATEALESVEETEDEDDEAEVLGDY